MTSTDPAGRLREAAQHARYGADLPDVLREPLAAWLEYEALLLVMSSTQKVERITRALAVADAILGPPE